MHPRADVSARWLRKTNKEDCSAYECGETCIQDGSQRLAWRNVWIVSGRRNSCSQTRKDFWMEPPIEVEGGYRIGEQTDGNERQGARRSPETTSGPVLVMSEVHDDEETRGDACKRRKNEDKFALYIHLCPHCLTPFHL